MILNKKFSVSNGELAQLKFQEFCLHNKWECAIPNTQSLPYDFVVRDDKGNFQTIQVKQAYKKRDRNQIMANVCRTSGNKTVQYNEEDFDLLAVYNKFIDSWYMIPYKKVSHIKRSISLTNGSWDNYLWNRQNTKKAKKKSSTSLKKAKRTKK